MHKFKSKVEELVNGVLLFVWYEMVLVSLSEQELLNWFIIKDEMNQYDNSVFFKFLIANT